MNIDWLIENKEFIGLVISFLSIVLPFATLILTKNKEQKQINFERFHNNLMKGLANLEGETGFDQQVAIIYELRNYPEYYPVIRRVLNAQILRWKAELKKSPHYTQLIDEAEKTINFSRKNIFERKRYNLFTKE